MKKLLIIIVTLILATGLSACSTDDDSSSIPEVPEQPGGNNSGNEEPDDDNNMKLVIKINSTEFTATLTDNATANAFKKMLPMTVSMTEHAGNEKYYDLKSNLPTNSSNPGIIQNGDLMLYGSRTLVLFYKSFSTSYSYTRIGRVDNPDGLERVLGTGSVTVTIEQAVEEK